MRGGSVYLTIEGAAISNSECYIYRCWYRVIAIK